MLVSFKTCLVEILKTSVQRSITGLRLILFVLRYFLSLIYKVLGSRR